MKLGGGVFDGAYQDAIGIIDNGIVGDHRIADIATDAVIGEMRRAVAVRDTGDQTAIQIIVGNERSAGIVGIGGTRLQENVFL